MVILLNKKACAATAYLKWNRIKNLIPNLVGKYILIQSNEYSAQLLLNQFQNGERKFIAAGGDGTVNFLVNTLFANLEYEQFSTIQFGALGLGSSNDFHKPFCKNKFIANIPCKLDFDNSYYQDLGKLLWVDEQNVIHNNYWINNSSVGVTAEANFLFNNSGKVLTTIKSINTNQAILYTAVKTILTYKNILVDLLYDEQLFSNIKLTNLGIVKNPNFSGSFCYNSPYAKNSGLFNLHICENMNKAQTLNVLYHLSHQKFIGLKNTKSIKAKAAKIVAKDSFAVEYDGEVIKTNQVEFSLIKNGIFLCA